ncbi:MAG: hypothetical protein AAF985_24445, partial [Bacteroidota bacterium]
MKRHQSLHPLSWKQEAVHPESLPAVVHKAPLHLYEEMQVEVARIHLRYIEEALKKYEVKRNQKELAAKELKVH